jgi:hypothetical protein
MRISVDPSDRAYTGERYYGATVSLDGVVLRDCVTADDEIGEIVIFKRDKDGNLILNKQRDWFVRQPLTGKVKIELGEVGKSLARSADK